jgi:hypothetical protein
VFHPFFYPDGKAVASALPPVTQAEADLNRHYPYYLSLTTTERFP